MVREMTRARTCSATVAVLCLVPIIATPAPAYAAPNVLQDMTTHSFRKSVATMIDDRGLSARIGADQPGHARPSMPQDRYMARVKVHKQVAEALDAAISGANAL